jgi:hypothetical protein
MIFVGWRTRKWFSLPTRTAKASNALRPERGKNAASRQAPAEEAVNEIRPGGLIEQSPRPYGAVAQTVESKYSPPFQRVLQNSENCATAHASAKADAYNSLMCCRRRLQPARPRSGGCTFCNTLSKEGWTRPQENAAKPFLIGADGVVRIEPRSAPNFSNLSTTPSARSKVASRFFLIAPPPLL